MDNRLIIRDYSIDDRSYVVKSWLMALHTIPPFRECKDRLYYPGAQKLADRVLGSPCARVAVIATVADPEFIVGYAVYWSLPNTAIVWFIYVRDTWRQLGLATHLADAIPTKKVAFVFKRLYNGIDFGKKIGLKRGWEYWPTLMFEAFSPEFSYSGE
jgi:hypothetical protein